MSNVADMLRLVESLPRQIEETERLVQGVQLPHCQGVRRVIVAGMGGSAAAASLLAGALWDSPVAVEVQRGYRLPGFASEDDLLVFSSYSGNTEETLAAFRRARESLGDAPCVVVASGGELARLAQEQELPWVRVPGGLPPRASLGYGLGVLTRILARTRMVPQLELQLAEAVEVLDRGNATLAPLSADNEAQRIAQRLAHRLPLLVGGTAVTEAAAWRLKAQINENSKALAYVGTLPELDHNEIVGFETATPVRSSVTVLALRDRGEHPRVARRFSLTRELLGDRCEAWEEIPSRGEAVLARLASLVQFGDFLSVYLAQAHGADPLPVETIERLKQRLAQED